MRGMLLAILVGVGLRMAVAYTAGVSVREWEADSVLRCWEASSWPPSDGVRPPLASWLLHALAGGGSGSIGEVRLLAVGLSLLTMAGVVLLARALAGALVPQRTTTAMTWAAWAWALSPTLVLTARSPVADSLVGALLCVLLASAVRLGRLLTGGGSAARVLAMLAVAGAVAVAVLAGGLVVAIAVIAGALGSLLPLPPLRRAVLPVLAVLLGLAVAAWSVAPGADVAQSGAARPMAVLPAEAAPARSVLALLGRPAGDADSVQLEPQRRAAAARSAALTAASDAGPWAVARALARRLFDELLAPARFGEAGATWWMGVLDVLLRAGLVAAALLGLAQARRQRGGSGAAVGPLAGVVVLLVGLVAAATHPFALAPLDAVLAAAGTVGLLAWRAGAEPARGSSPSHEPAPHGPPPRWPGLLLLAALAVTPAAVVAVRDRGPSPWLLTLDQDQRRGAHLVELLADGGPHDALGELSAANAFADRHTPFLRWPEAARRHALRAVAAAPADARALQALVKAEVENLQFDRAADLAGTLLEDSGVPTADGRVLSTWVRDEERRWRAQRYR